MGERGGDIRRPPFSPFHNNHRMAENLSSHAIIIIVSIAFFLLGFLPDFGFLSEPDLRLPTEATREAAVGDFSPLPRHHQQPSQEQEEFQQLLAHMHFKDCSRVLKFNIASDMLQEEAEISTLLHHVTSALRVAIATDRYLELVWPPSIRAGDLNPTKECGGNIHCNLAALYPPCSGKSKEITSRGGRNQILPLRRGILPDTNESDFFNVAYYGDKHVVELSTSEQWPKRWLIDTLEGIERSLGRFWIDSQITGYLLSKISYGDFCTSPPVVGDRKPSSVGILLDGHDNNQVTQVYARNFEKTASLSRIVSILRLIQSTDQNVYQQVQILSRHTPKNFEDKTFDELQTIFPTWRFQTTVDRDRSDRTPSNTDQLTMLADLSRHKYLIGSYTSAFYRLATQLNSFCNSQKDAVPNPIPGPTFRHFGLDIEWFSI